MRARGQNQTIIHPVAAAVDDYFRFLRTRWRIGSVRFGLVWIGIPGSAHANTSCWVSFDFCECGPLEKLGPTPDVVRKEIGSRIRW